MPCGKCKIKPVSPIQSISSSLVSISASQLNNEIIDMHAVTHKRNICLVTCRSDSTTPTRQSKQMKTMLAIILIPVSILVGLTGNSFMTAVNNYVDSTSIRSTLLFSLDMALMIRSLQRERDGSALYLSSIRPETKDFLLQLYKDTDTALQDLPEWPVSLSNTMSELDSSQTFLKELTTHRYELDIIKVTFHQELITYSDWIEQFIKWFYKSILEARAEKVWTALVAYQELLVASEYLGRERAVGVIFYTLGEFPTREEYLYFVESQDISSAAFAAARQYSTLAKEIYDAKLNANPEILQTIKKKRSEIRRRNTGAVINSVGSLKEAKFWFENMTYFQDIIREAQVSLALRIDGLLVSEQQTDLTNIIIICIILCAVFLLCPIIIYAVYSITVKTESCSLLIAERSKAIRKEKKRVHGLLCQMLPKHIVDNLNQNKNIRMKRFNDATLMLCDIFGFTDISSRSSPLQTVEMLNRIFACLDERITLYDVYKVETFGDAYLIVSGVPVPNGKRHVSEIASLSLDIFEHVSRVEIRHIPDSNVRLRIGCHSGPVVAGVVGTKMSHYAVLGETIDVTHMIEATGEPCRIHLSQTTADILVEVGGFVVNERGNFPEMNDHDLLKAFQGNVKTYWLEGLKTLPPPQCADIAHNQAAERRI